MVFANETMEKALVIYQARQKNLSRHGPTKPHPELEYQSKKVYVQRPKSTWHSLLTENTRRV